MCLFRGLDLGVGCEHPIEHPAHVVVQLYVQRCDLLVDEREPSLKALEWPLQLGRRGPRGRDLRALGFPRL